MTSVYGVWSGYEDMDGVFSTKEKAEEYVRRMVALWGSPREQYSVFEYVIDELLHQPQER